MTSSVWGYKWSGRNAGVTLKAINSRKFKSPFSPWWEKVRMRGINDLIRLRENELRFKNLNPRGFMETIQLENWEEFEE